jgi:hypothetical protein
MFVKPPGDAVRNSALAGASQSVLTIYDYDLKEQISATRTGFLLSSNLAILPSFRRGLGDIKVFDCRDAELEALELAYDDALGLQLASVSTSAGRPTGAAGVSENPEAAPGLSFAKVLPLHPGTRIYGLGMDGWNELRVKAVREHPQWGTALELSSVTEDLPVGILEGAPLIDKDGQLVGVLRLRNDRARNILGLPVTSVLQLLREGLSSAVDLLNELSTRPTEGNMQDDLYARLAYVADAEHEEWLTKQLWWRVKIQALRDALASSEKVLDQWRVWRNACWDEEHGMTKREYDQKNEIAALRQQVEDLHGTTGARGSAIIRFFRFFKKSKAVASPSRKP